MDRNPFVDHIIRMLVVDQRSQNGQLVSRRASSCVISLTGAWGSGKSSIVELLDQRLSSMAYVIPIQFNPWMFSGREELLPAFFAATRQIFTTTLRSEAAHLIGALNKYSSALGLQIKPGELIKSSANEAKAKLENAVSEINCAIVVIIDEIDRLDDSEIREIMRLARGVGDIKGISYLLSYDHDRVAQALSNTTSDTNSGERYLEKIVQHTVPIRPMVDRDKRNLLISTLNADFAKFESPAYDHQSKIWDRVISSIETPRDIKRLCGTWKAISSAVLGDVCDFDLLGYSWIAVKYPGIRERIQQHFERLVDDPEAGEAIARSSEKTPDDTLLLKILGNEAVAVIPILRHLFPRFGVSRSGQDGIRISLRQNLLRVLFLGNPPGMITRREVEDLFNCQSQEDIVSLLTHYRENDRLSDVLSRCRDLIDRLPPETDIKLWKAIAAVLVKKTVWTSEPEDLRDRARDAVSLLNELAELKPDGAFRASTVLKALLDDEDLTIAPFVVRQQMYVYGFGKDGRPRHRPNFMSAEDTRSIVERVLPYYRDCIISGHMLKHMPHEEPMWLWFNMGRWDEVLRYSLTKQIEDINGLVSFCCLTVPPGFGVDRSVLRDLFQFEPLIRSLNHHIAEIETRYSAWAISCVHKLARIIKTGDSFGDGPATGLFPISLDGDVEA